MIVTTLLVVSLLHPAYAKTRGKSVIAFTHISVIPMDSERVIANQTVVITDGFITSMGDSDKMAIPRNATRIRGDGKYLMPGLVDSHVHLHSTTEMPLYLVNGVTTVFDLNGRPATLSWKRKIAAGQILDAPTIFSTGPKFDRVRTPAEAAREVEEQWSAGYDGVKIYPQVSKEEFPSLIAAANSKGMIIVGHIARRVGFEKTVQSGQSIAHVEEYLYTFFNFPKTDDLFEDNIELDETQIPKVVEETRASGVSVIATLVTYDHIVQQATDPKNYLRHPELNYIAPYLRDKMEPARNVYFNGFSAEEKATLPDNLAFQKKLVKSLNAAGVPIIAGTDSLGVGPVAGFSLHEELRNFVSLGMTPYEALKTATTNSAAFLKSTDNFGTVAIGKRADLLLLNANPLSDIHSSSNISGVMIRGRWIAEPQLKRLLDRVPAAYLNEERRVESDLKDRPAGAVKYLSENDPFGGLTGWVLKERVLKTKVQEVDRVLSKLRNSFPESGLIREDTLNSLGYGLARMSDKARALEVFKLNSTLYPKSVNVWDSLGEMYESSGNNPAAIESYLRGLQLDPSNKRLLAKLRKLEVKKIRFR